MWPWGPESLSEVHRASWPVSGPTQPRARFIDLQRWALLSLKLLFPAKAGRLASSREPEEAIVGCGLTGIKNKDPQPERSGSNPSFTTPGCTGSQPLNRVMPQLPHL